MSAYYRAAANLLLVVHFAYVAFVVFGFIAILAGLVFRRAWARSPLLRWLHLVAILIVAGEAILNITCPLTTLERRFRILAGQAVTDGDFIAIWLHDLMFFELPEWVFTAAYVSFGAGVLLVFVLYPPRRGLQARILVDRR